MPLFPCKTRSLCIDNPLSNLSAEGPEDQVRFIGRMQSLLEPPLDEAWQSNGCLALCVSDISQEDADLCAERQAVLCVFPALNEPQTCIVNCADGLPFSYTVNAGIFAAATVEEANKVAYAYACEQANAQKICISSLGECSLCVNENSRIGILAENVPVGSVWSLSGNPPPGMTLEQNSPGDAIMQGVPEAVGNYFFQITVTTPSGNFMTKEFTLAVIAIATTALTPYQTGVPYSFQLQAIGGSGNFAWRIVAGSLPAGLVMDVDGLIHGTPTNTTTNAVTFHVVDTDCETPGKEFFPPRVAMTTVSETIIATLRGFSEYAGTGITPSVPPKKYKKLTWSGFSEQWGDTLGDTAMECGRARYDWSGSSEIDLAGNFITKYQKTFSVSCPTATLQSDWPDFVAGVGVTPGTSGVPQVFKGYCFVADPNSCQECQTPLTPIGNVSPNSPLDGSDFLGPSVAAATVITATTLTVMATGTTAVLLLNPAKVSNLPEVSFNGITGPWIILRSNDDYQAVLSVEYTDAEALANAVRFTSNSRAAESRPRTTGFVSTWTTVEYTLNFSNLIVGEDYVASVVLLNDNGTTVTVPFSFTAEADTHEIAGTVPTPADGHTIEVRSPKVGYAPPTE